MGAYLPSVRPRAIVMGTNGVEWNRITHRFNVAC